MLLMSHDFVTVIIYNVFYVPSYIDTFIFNGMN